jgi:hypothetical protein
MSKDTTMKVYAARDRNTGKYVSDLTSHRKKFWERKNACVEAVTRYNSHRYYINKYDLEVVELACVDVDEYVNFNKLADLYIKDTSCDGQLFCGCRREDCELYKTEECRKCLIKHLNDMENN